MLDAEKIELVQAMTGETTESVVSAYLKIAGEKICRKAYPFAPDVTEVPDQYAYTQVEIAVYLLNKRGAEGQTTHNENGVYRTYEDGDIPASLLRQIVPVAGVLE